ncbi:MAG TPA: phage tail protein [Rhizobium sp.]|nr:phage tail protein [Rhizobium sp.]
MALLALGPHLFEIEPLNFQAIDRETTVKWPAISRFGARPGRQMTGYGEDPIRISGMLYPDEIGGRDEFEALRDTQLKARPVTMVGWKGSGTAARIYGRVVILSIRDQQSSINRDGHGRRLGYDIELAPAGVTGKPIGLF